MTDIPNNSVSGNIHPQNESLQIRRYLSLFLSNWYWFTLSLILAIMLAYGVNTYSEKVYTVSSSMLIKDEQGTGMAGVDRLMPGSELFKSMQNLHNEIAILKSYSVNYSTVLELPEFNVSIVGIGRRGIAQVRHYNTAPFFVLYDSLLEQKPNKKITLRITSDDTFTLVHNGTEFNKGEYHFGDSVFAEGFNFIIDKRDTASFHYDENLSNRYIFWFNRPEQLANSYRSRLSINPVNEEATLVNLSISGYTPQQESDYLNKLMEVYNRNGLDYKNETADNAIKFIDSQLRLISDSLTRVEEKLEDFREKNSIIDLSTEGTLIKTKLQSFTNERIAAGLQKQYYEYLSEYIDNRSNSGDIVTPAIMGITDQMLIGLVGEYSKLQNDRKQIGYNITVNQPSLGLIDSRIEDVRLSLKENVRNNILNINRTIADIDNRISGVEKEMNLLPGTERSLITIQREFDLNNTVYTYMLEKRSEAAIAKASNVPGNRIIDKAATYNKTLIKPRAKRNYIMALMLGFFIPGLYVFLIDLFHNKIFDRGDIEEGTSVSIIGFIGHNTFNSELPVIEKPGSSLSESFRTLRTNLKYYLGSAGKGVISVTSTISGEGKTFMSFNLAAVLASSGKKTLLVSMDMRRPRMEKLIGLRASEGLSTFLTGESQYEDIVRPTKTECLYLVPAGPVPPNPAELLDSEKMKFFIDKVKGEFDYIVLDTPPVGVVSDALITGVYSDVNIFVIRQRYSYKSSLELIQALNDRKELKNLAIAVNDIHITGYYGYGLRYGYGFYQGYGYKYGYGQYYTYGKNDYQKYYEE